MLAEKNFEQKSTPVNTRLSRLFHEGAWVAVGQIAAAAGLIVFVRATTEAVEPTEYGQVALALAAGNLLCQTVMSVNVGVGRYYAVAAEVGDPAGYAAAIDALVSRLATASTALALAIVGILFVSGFSSWIPLTIATAIYAIASGANGTASAIQTAARRRKNVAVHQGAEAWIRIAAVMAAIPMFGPSSTTVIAAYGVAGALVTISQRRFANRLLGPRTERHGSPSAQEWRNKIVAFSTPFMLWGGFSWIQQSSDRWALEAFASTAEVGKFAVLVQLGYTPVTMLAGMIVALIAPVLYQRAGDGRDESRNRHARNLAHQTMAIVVSAALLAFIGCLFIHEWIFRFLVAEAYRDLSGLLPWVILSAGLFAAGQVLALDFMATMRTRALLWVKISTAVFGAGCNFMGAWLSGTTGVVVGLVAFAAVYFLATALLTKTAPMASAQNQRVQ